MKRRLWALTCGWLLSQHLAQAKSPVATSARLELVKGPGTEQCLDQKSLLRAVEARLRRRAFRADIPATLYVEIAIAREGNGWSASLTMYDSTKALLGRRSLATGAAHCSALDDSLALVVALLVDSPPGPLLESSQALPAEGTKGPATKATPAPPAAPTTDAKAQQIAERPPIQLPRDTPAPREPWRFRLAAEGTLALGMLPGFAPGLELGFGAKAPRLPELRFFAGWYAQREQLRSELDAGAHFDFAHLGLELCPFEHEFGVAEWFVCAGQSLGRLRVASFGFDENLTSNHLTYAILARTGIQVALATHWAARFGIRAELPLARGVFSYGTPEGGQQVLFRASPITAVLDLGLVVNL